MAGIGSLIGGVVGGAMKGRGVGMVQHYNQVREERLAQLQRDHDFAKLAMQHENALALEGTRHANSLTQIDTRQGRMDARQEAQQEAINARQHTVGADGSVFNTVGTQANPVLTDTGDPLKTTPPGSRATSTTGMTQNQKLTHARALAEGYAESEGLEGGYTPKHMMRALWEVNQMTGGGSTDAEIADLAAKLDPQHVPDSKVTNEMIAPFSDAVAAVKAAAPDAVIKWIGGAPAIYTDGVFKKLPRNKSEAATPKSTEKLPATDARTVTRRRQRGGNAGGVPIDMTLGEAENSGSRRRKQNYEPGTAGNVSPGLRSR